MFGGRDGYVGDRHGEGRGDLKHNAPRFIARNTEGKQAAAATVRGSTTI